MSQFLYQDVYQHFKDMILSGQLAADSRMPSIRKCTSEMNVSRTTVENAYLQLAAEGYIISRPQSGYYVTDIRSAQDKPDVSCSSPEKAAPIRYDFASSGVDRRAFRFDLWQRYIKSALRQDERMLSYGEPQGESDFRAVLSEYVRKKRNIICTPDQIVVGAGVQSLLSILLPLLRDCRTVSFPDGSFLQGSTVFRDFGYEVHTRDKNCDVIYVSPAHMTKWGDVMPVSRRLELLKHAQLQGSLILEDDYENEFVYQQKPTPSLFSMSRNRNVVYFGSFSRLLLPSIRISFMILPQELLGRYRSKGEAYNQTASKAEQIALCQYIRDGHLESQSKKLNRLYAQKMKQLVSMTQEIFGPAGKLKYGLGGTTILLTLPHGRTERGSTAEELQKNAQAGGLRIRIFSFDDKEVSLLLSCSSMPVEDFRDALTALKGII